MPVLTLIGYMGSGKSTLGKLLAEELNLEFLDLDDFLEIKHSISIAQMFTQYGEKWFRNEESKALSEVLNGDDRVLALGGGTPVHNNNIDLINSKSNSIYIRWSVEGLFNNLKNQKSQRPLIKDLSNDNLKAFISENLAKRDDKYKMAKHTVQCDNKGKEEILKELIRLYNL